MSRLIAQIGVDCTQMWILLFIIIAVTNGSAPYRRSQYPNKILVIDEKALQPGALFAFWALSLTHPMTQTVCGSRSLEKIVQPFTSGTPGLLFLLAASTRKTFFKKPSKPVSRFFIADSCGA